MDNRNWFQWAEDYWNRLRPQPAPAEKPAPAPTLKGTWFEYAEEPWREARGRATATLGPPQRPPRPPTVGQQPGRLFSPGYWEPGLRASLERFGRPILERMRTGEQGPLEFPQVLRKEAPTLGVRALTAGIPLVGPVTAPMILPSMIRLTKAAYHDARRFPPGTLATGIAEGGLKVVGGLLAQFTYGLERGAGETEMRTRNTTLGQVHRVERGGKPIRENELQMQRHALLDQIQAQDPQAENWVINQLSRITWSPDEWQEQVVDPLTGKTSPVTRGKITATRELYDLWKNRGSMSYPEFSDATEKTLERQQQPLYEFAGQALFDPLNLIGVRLGKSRDAAKMGEIADALTTAVKPKLAEEIAQVGVKGIDTLLNPFRLTRGSLATTARRAFGDILSNAVVETERPEQTFQILKAIRDNPDSLTHLGLSLESEEGQIARMILGEIDLDGKLTQLSLIPEGTPYRAADVITGLIDEASEIANRIYNVDADVLPGPLGELEKIVNRIRPYAGDAYIANPGQTFRNTANNMLKLAVGEIFGTEDVPSVTRWFDEKLGFVPQDVAQGFGRFEYGAKGGFKNFPLIGPWMKFWGEKMRGTTRFLGEGWARAVGWKQGTNRAKLGRWQFGAEIPELPDELLRFLSPEQGAALRRGIEEGWKREDFIKALDNILGGRYVAAEFTTAEAEIPEGVLRQLQQVIDDFQGRKISDQDFLKSIDLIAEDGFKTVLRHSLEDVGTPSALNVQSRLGPDGVGIAGAMQRSFEQSWARFYRAYGSVSDDAVKRQKIIDIWTASWREQWAETSWYYMDSGQVPAHLLGLPSSPGVPGKQLLDDAGRNGFWMRFRTAAEQRWLGTNGAASQADSVAGIERLKRMVGERMPKPTEAMMQEGWLQGTQKRLQRLDTQVAKLQQQIAQMPAEARTASEIAERQKEAYELSSSVATIKEELAQLPNSRTCFRFFDYVNGIMRKVREPSGRVVDFEYSQIAQGIAKERFGLEESVEGAEEFGKLIRRAVEARRELRGIENQLSEKPLYVVPESLEQLEKFIANSEDELGRMADLSREPERFETMLATLEEAYETLAKLKGGEALPETIAAKVGSLQEEIARAAAERKGLAGQVEVYRKWDITHSPIKSATPQTSEVADVIYQDVLKLLQRAQTTVLNEPVRPGASPYAYEAGMRYLDGTLMPALHDERLIWTKIGKWMSDEALFDYTRRFTIDKLLALGMPYHFWPTREASFWLRRMFTKPWFFTSYIRFQKFLGQMEAEQPYRLRRSLRVPVPESLRKRIPGEPEAFYVDPASKIWPFVNVWPFSVLHYVDWWDDPEAKNGVAQWYDLAETLGARPWFFIDLPLRMAGGLTEEQKRSAWWLTPLTAGIKASSALLKEAFPGGMWWVPPGGINIEAGKLFSDEAQGHMQGVGVPPGVPYLTAPGLNIRKFLGMMDSPWSEQIYWPLQYLAFDVVTDKITEEQADAAMLYFLVSTDQITEVEATTAMPGWESHKAKETWETAFQRGAVQRAYSTAGSFWLGQPVNIQTQGEAEVRKLMARLNELGYDPEKRPEGTAAERRQMYEEQPALGVRQRAMEYVASGPQALTQAVLKSEFWGRYNQIQTERQKEVDAYIREHPGDTRRYDDQGNPRGLGIIEEKYDQMVQNFPGDIPSTYKMNPTEVKDLQTRLIIQDILKSYPNFEDFPGPEGEPDYEKYNQAIEQFFQSVETGTGPAMQESIAQAMRLYGGLSEEDARALVVSLVGGKAGIEQYWRRNDSILEAANRVYRDYYIEPALEEFYKATQIEQSGAKKIAIDEILKKYGPITAEALIPTILEVYKERGWTEEELRAELGAPLGAVTRPEYPPEIGRWADLVSDVLKENDLPETYGPVVAAIIAIESGGNPDAVNAESGATGLMQIMPMHFEEGQDPKDPEWNLRKGVAILKENVEATASLQKALFLYSGRRDRPWEPYLGAYWQPFLQKYQEFTQVAEVPKGLVFPGLEGYRAYARTPMEATTDRIYREFDEARRTAGFPDSILILQDAYFASGPSGSEGRARWKQWNPAEFAQLKRYWDWREGYKAEHEDYATLLEGYAAQGGGEGWGWNMPQVPQRRLTGGGYAPQAPSQQPYGRTPWWDWGPLGKRVTWRW